MNSAASLQEAAFRLIDVFEESSKQNKRPRFQAKVASILREHYTTESDTTIYQRFCGIEEKCRVLNNDELADALVSNYNKLSQWQSRSKHDVISFLLHLADNPVKKTKLDELEHAIPAPEASELTWKDILKDEPWEDKSIWNSIDYAASSSGSQWSDSDSAEHLEEDNESRSDESIRPTTASSKVNDEELNKITKNREAYPTRTSDGALQLTDTQLIREILFMFQGLPSIVYETKKLKIVAHPCLVGDLTLPIVQSLLTQICEIGTSLAQIRNYLQQPQHNPVLQAFQACTQDLINDWNRQLSRIEQEILEPQEQACTLLSTTARVDLLFQPLMLFVSIIKANVEHNYLLLQALFELVVEQESIGDHVSFKIAGTVFRRCLDIYMRPIRTWIQSGKLADSDDVFVQRTIDTRDHSLLWQNQFSLVLKDDGTPAVPAFLHTAVDQIFAAGKNVNLLQSLDPEHFQTSSIQHTNLDIEQLFEESRSELDSFDERFYDALADWLRHNCSTTGSESLKAYIEKSQFKQVLSNLEYVYFQKNGAVAQQIAYSIFDRMDRQKHWRDRFYLTDLCQECLTTCMGSDAKQISVSITKKSSMPMGFMQEIALIKIKFDIPRAATMVLSPKYLEISQDIFTLLFQLSRATQILDRHGTFRTPGSQALRSKSHLLLQQRLRWFVNALRSFITTNVLQTAIPALYENMDKAGSLDQLMQAVYGCFNQLETDCLLHKTQEATRVAILSILDIAVLFSFPRRSVSESEDRYRAMEDSEDSDDGIEAPAQLVDTSPTNHHATTQQYSATFDKLLNSVIADLQEMTRTSQQSVAQSLLDDLKFGSNQI